MAEKHMLERTEGDLEGLNSEAKRVKLEEQVTTVAIPQPKVTKSVQFRHLTVLEACFMSKYFITPSHLMIGRHVLTT